MRRIMYFRVAGRDVHLPKLIGAFILFASLLMFVQSSAQMFDSWDNLKHYDSCILKINSNASLDGQRAEFNSCSDTLYKATGIVVREDVPKLTARQFWSGLLGSIASLLFWLAILFVGYVLYRSGDLVIPIEERIVTEPEHQRKRRK